MNPFVQIGQVEGINNSGSVIVGCGHPSNWGHAYRFTSWNGHVRDLGALEREGEFEDTSMALAVSDDGTVVVGMSGYQPPTEAFIWTPETKMVKLSDYLTNKG
jgi:probable HAF family extracellular repeat protein